MTKVFPYSWRRRSRRPRGGGPPGSADARFRTLPFPEERGLTSGWARYGASAALAAVALAAERTYPWFFDPHVFLFLYPCVFLTAALAGTGPALMNVLISTVSAWWIMVMTGEAALNGPSENAARLALFAVFGAAGAWVIGRGRLAEMKLRRSEADLRAAQEVGRIGSWQNDLTRNELTWSEQTYRMFGVPVGTPLAYEDFLRAVHPDDREVVDGVWAAALRGEPYDDDYRVVVGGQVRWINARAQVEFDEDGKPLRGIGTVQDITERRRAEEEIRTLRENERFRLALETAGTAMIIVAQDGSILFANGEAERLFGWTRRELQGRRVETLIPERFRAAHPAMRQAFFKERGARRMGPGRELFALRKDGTEVPVEISLTRFTDHGTADFVVASITDISARKAAEEERGRLLQEALEDLAAMRSLRRLGSLPLEGSDLKPLLGEVLDAAIAISGADFGNIQLLDPGTGDLRIAVHRGFPSWWLEFWNTVSTGKGACGTALERGERVIIEDVERSPIFQGTQALEMQRRAGVRAVQSTPLLSRSGARVGMVSTHYKTPRRPSDRAARLLDLLARQAADLIEQARIQETLRQSEQRLRLLVEGTREYAIYMQDLEGRVTVWNEGGARIYGYSSEEVLGRSVRDFLPQDVLASGRPEDEQRLALERGSYESEDWRQRKDGTRFWASVVTTPVFSPDGKHLGFGKVVRDLSEPRRAARALDNTTERLQRTVLELESFAYTISHDLRSPLRAIEGYAHFLSRRLASSADPETRSMLERMARAASRLDNLIRDLLSYNAVARQEVELTAVDLDETLSHVAGHYPEVARAAVRVRAPLGKALGQPSLLIQVFANLLVNAAKFVPPDRKPEIEIWAERAGGRVTVVVQDNGIGIPRAAWERVFKPFERLHPDAAYEGTGIGLAVVKRAVEKMGGCVDLESEPGRGTRFRVSLREA